jgi:hypothetical protein
VPRERLLRDFSIAFHLVIRGSTVMSIVVENIEELKSVRTKRAHPVVTIVGELANNLLISGVVRPIDQGTRHAEVIKLADSKSPELCSVISLLQDLSGSHLFEVEGDTSLRTIKMYPKPSLRREGN